METTRQTKKSTYDIGSACAMLAVIIILIVMTTGCTNMTVVKLAEMCHAEHMKPNTSFNGSTGRVDCK